MTEHNGRGATVLVTGGTGYLAGWCIVDLLQHGHRVRTTMRSLGREAELRDSLSRQVELGDRLECREADLTGDAGWNDAVAGCDYVLHVASPFPPAQPKDPDELIVPARDGALRVLKASFTAGAQRVVMTSSVAAVRNSGEAHSARALTEDDWTDPATPGLTPYAQSKTIAEREAWAFARASGDGERLAVVNPGAILGPTLSRDHSFSLQVIERMLGGMPALPRLGFAFVDVRDVAAMHVAAMTTPAAGDQRFIATGPFLWMTEVAQILRDRLGDRAPKIPHRIAPNIAIRAMALFDPGLRTIVPDLGVETSYSTDKASKLLGWSARPVEETIVDCAESILAEN